MAAVLEIQKLGDNNLYRIRKDSKYSFDEQYRRVHQMRTQACHQQIDNIFVLVSFTTDVWVQYFDETIRKRLTIPHCAESELARHMGSPIRRIEYSENGKRVLPATKRGGWVYQNLIANEMNTLHLYMNR
jgi:hypothetical protein